MIKHHFFGKDLIIDRPLSQRSHLKLRLAEEGFKNDHVLFVNQIHGNEVVIIDDEKKIYGQQDLPKADAIVTNLKKYKYRNCNCWLRTDFIFRLWK